MRWAWVVLAMLGAACVQEKEAEGSKGGRCRQEATDGGGTRETCDPGLVCVHVTVLGSPLNPGGSEATCEDCGDLPPEKEGWADCSNEGTDAGPMTNN